MNLENKKQVAILVIAVCLGLAAVVLMGNHIQTSIKAETARISNEFEQKRLAPLLNDMKAMQGEIRKLKSRPTAEGTGTASGQEIPAVPKSSLALRTPAGKRAYTVRIDSLSAVGGLINPGDYVDVIAHMDVPDPNEEGKKVTETVSSMVFQNVQILAVGTNLQAPGGYDQQQKARSLNVTFALTPQEAGLVAFLEKHGKLQLVLRAPAETETEVLQSSNWETLAEYVLETQGTELAFPQEKPKAKPVTPRGDVEEVGEEPAGPYIEIYRGGREL